MRSQNGDKISSIQLIDRNGINETISNQDRVALLRKADYLRSQPYQKVVRTYRPNDEGKIASKMTTYHENGEIWQYLEAQGGRAHGEYKEN